MGATGQTEQLPLQPFEICEKVPGMGSIIPDETLMKLEEQITSQANQLDIGPMGFRGKTTVLGAKIKNLHRLPASYFVSISYMCWAYRRRSMVFQDGEITYH